PTSVSGSGNDSLYEQEFLGYPGTKSETESKKSDRHRSDELQERIESISSEERARIAPWTSPSIVSSQPSFESSSAHLEGSTLCGGQSKGKNIYKDINSGGLHISPPQPQISTLLRNTQISP